MKAAAVEKRYLARPQPAADLQVERTEGSYVYDVRGERYVDFLMGWCVGNLGWGHEEMWESIREYDGPEYVDPSVSYVPWVELAELLATITPGELQKSFRATGGTEAVELALQAALVHTEREHFLSIDGSYHGNSIATLSIGGSAKPKPQKLLLPHCHKISPPLDAAALERVEIRLKDRDIAAVILEPVIISLGVVSPDAEFVTGLRRLCLRYDTLLIMDEVATGFGRTGKLFATEHYGIEPDIMCLAKAITGGYAPLGAMIATEEVANTMEHRGSFYATYGWHPLGVHVALANIRYILRHERRLLGNVGAMSDFFRDRIASMEFERPPEVRIRGLAIGIDVEDRAYAKRIRDRCREAGLLLTTEHSTLLLLPALNIDEEVAEEGLDILESCL